CSPKRSAVNCQLCDNDQGKIIIKQAKSPATTGHEARAKLPIVQNISACKSCASATNCNNATAALSENTNAIPNKTIPAVFIPPKRATKSSNNAEAKAKPKANSDTISACDTPG